MECQSRDFDEPINGLVGCTGIGVRRLFFATQSRVFGIHSSWAFWTRSDGFIDGWTDLELLIKSACYVNAAWYFDNGTSNSGCITHNHLCKRIEIRWIDTSRLTTIWIDPFKVLDWLMTVKPSLYCFINSKFHKSIIWESKNQFSWILITFPYTLKIVWKWKRFQCVVPNLFKK